MYSIKKATTSFPGFGNEVDVATASSSEENINWNLCGINYLYVLYLADWDAWFEQLWQPEETIPNITYKKMKLLDRSLKISLT